MIEVVIRNPATDLELARIEIKNLGLSPDGHCADYSVKFGVERGTAVGLHKRILYGFPRRRYNVLALLKQALETLDPKELELERDFDPDGATNRASNLARRLRRARPEV